MASAATGSNLSSTRTAEGGFVPAILGGGRKRKTEVSLEANKRRKMDEDVHVSQSSSSSSSSSQASNASNAPRRIPLSSISTSRQNVLLSPNSGVLSGGNYSAKKRSPSSKENFDVSPPTSPSTKLIKMRSSWSEFRRFIHEDAQDAETLARKNKSPFPELSWADKNELWKLMCKKESGVYRRKHGEVILNRHPSFQPRMRAILLDWLIEVCEVYRLHRETFYLAVDFIDRYLSVTQDMPKNKLQLIGVSCLFIGAKIEEIYPPKLKEFAYVTDGACTEEQILEMELVILKALNWSLCPVTPNAWMKLFLQLHNCDKTPRNENFVNSQFSGLPFSRIMQLIDLCTMDIGSLSFKYSVLVAAALYHFDNEQVALESSGYEWKDISACVNWMSAFAFALREHSPLQPRTFHNVPVDNQHNIQTHTVELTMLDRAQERLVLLMTSIDRDSPDPEDIVAPIHLGSLELTPPEEEGDVLYNPSTKDTAAAADSSASPGPSTDKEEKTSSDILDSPPSQDGDVSW